MSIILRDGSVVPKYMTGDADDQPGWMNFKTEYSIRMGRIVKAYSSDDKENLSKKFLEYDVEVFHSDGPGSFAFIVYRRCQVASLFGGVADFFKWTPRIDNDDPKSKISLGSRVLLLCVNGDAKSAFIIGGVPHFNNKLKETFQDNHHLEFEFNGVYINIDKEGTLSLIHRGATKADGSVIDDAGTNSSLQFSANGNITLGYNIQKNPQGGIEENSDALPFIGLLKQQNQITSYAKSDISAETEDRFLIKTTNGVKINNGGLFPQAFLRATIYRQQQEIMHNTIMPLLSTLSTLVTTSGATLTASGITLATVGAMHLVPVAGPLTASPILIATGATVGASGAALLAAGPIIAAIQAAMTVFESLSTQYLSNKHFHSEDPLL